MCAICGTGRPKQAGKLYCREHQQAVDSAARAKRDQEKWWDHYETFAGKFKILTYRGEAIAFMPSPDDPEKLRPELVGRALYDVPKGAIFDLAKRHDGYDRGQIKRMKRMFKELEV